MKIECYQCPLQVKCTDVILHAYDEKAILAEHRLGEEPGGIELHYERVVEEYDRVSEEAVKSCQGPKEQKRYLLFGRKILRCTSKKNRSFGIGYPL